MIHNESLRFHKFWKMERKKKVIKQEDKVYNEGQKRHTSLGGPNNDEGRTGR